MTEVQQEHEEEKGEEFDIQNLMDHMAYVSGQLINNEEIMEHLDEEDFQEMAKLKRVIKFNMKQYKQKLQKQNSLYKAANLM